MNSPSSSGSSGLGHGLPDQGLSSQDARARLQRDGTNTTADDAPRHVLMLLRDIITEPMFLLLLAAAGLYLLLGELNEALALSLSVLLIITITLLQERRTEHVLQQLKELSVAHVQVVRDGSTQSLPSDQLVVGDLVLLSEGERVPADALLIEAVSLLVDESILTGESLPVEKDTSDPHSRNSSVFSGTLILRGHASARITATGPRSEIGKIGRALSDLDVETAPLYRQMKKLTQQVAIIGIALCVCVAVVYTLARHDFLGGTLAGITLAMGVLPEEFPVVLTVFMAMGAWRIATHGVLVRRMPAIETIGAVTVLAVDKTGTLTENHMRLAVLDALDGPVEQTLTAPPTERTTHILFTALAASEQHAFDSLERAIHEAAQSHDQIDNQTHDHTRSLIQTLHTWKLVREYELTPQLTAVTHVWQDGEGIMHVTTKGAPETVLSLCQADEATRQTVMARVAYFAQRGLRLLAVAEGNWEGTHFPDTPHEFSLRLLGLIGLADPVRKTVPAALAECRSAGIRVLMITGDHAGTALTIAQTAGIDTTGGSLSGAEMQAMDDAQLSLRLTTCNVFARMTPLQKLRLVQLLKAEGATVAMTGDGVNDAPALKAAHVGVALGTRSTTVAREASALVLLQDDFASLVAAVRLGRRIYNNVRNAVSFILAVHIPIAGLGLLPVLFGWPLLLYPLHVMFLELVIDPACALVFEADGDDPQTMKRPPRPADATLFERNMFWQSCIRGGVMLTINIAVFALALQWSSVDAARALGFTVMVINTLLLIMVSRSNGDASVSTPRNRTLWLVAGSTVVLLSLVLFIPALAALFKFDTPTPWFLLLSLAACLLGWLLMKFLTRKKQQHVS